VSWLSRGRGGRPPLDLRGSVPRRPLLPVRRWQGSPSLRLCCQRHLHRFPFSGSHPLVAATLLCVGPCALVYLLHRWDVCVLAMFAMLHVTGLVSTPKSKNTVQRAQARASQRPRATHARYRAPNARHGRCAISCKSLVSKGFAGGWDTHGDTPRTRVMRSRHARRAGGHGGYGRVRILSNGLCTTDPNYPLNPLAMC
jgi:hypothetical protein